MTSKEFVELLSAQADEEKIAIIRRNIPLGVDASGQIACARKGQPLFFSRHTCVTGGGRSAFIRRLLITLACIYKREELCFFVLSPAAEYGELLRMKNMEITLPYIREKGDLERGVDTLKELLRMRECGKGYPRLLVVMDGVEGLEGCNRNQDLEEYRAAMELLSRREDVDLITGVDLTKSIFSGYPGAFVGIGNCLVATRELGKADVTYVQDDASLTMPMPITYPSAPSLTETVLFFNSVAKEE